MQIGPPQEITTARQVSSSPTSSARPTASPGRSNPGAGAVLLANGVGLAKPARANGTQPGLVALRPGAISLVRDGSRSAARHGDPVSSWARSVEYSVEVEGLGDFLVTADRRSLNDSDLAEPGERIGAKLRPNAMHVFPA
ncbi:hypothetical protein F2981_18070 [Sinorhizobium meliloti]|nr:hypothetical protein [Sinorhizobium meliloti]